MTKSANKQDLHFLHQLDLPTATVNHLSSHVKPIYFRRGDKIVRRGETCRNIYIIQSGIVRAYKDDDKSENVYAFYREKEFFTSPNSFMHGVPSESFIEAIEDCKMYVLTWKDFEAIGEKYPPILAQAFQILSAQLAELLREKNHLLTLSATQRYLYFLEKHSDLVHRIPLGYISTYLGMRQSSLSRVRREIHREFSN